MFETIEDPSILAGYLTDASNVQGRADALVRPESTEEVAAILEHCQQHNIPVTITAGRTSTTAGAVPNGGWLVSTERLTGFTLLGDGRASVQAGMYLGEFQQRLAEDGWLYPPDPTSRHECTVGASIACNASGACSFRYGNSRRWVEALTVVLPTGETLRVDRDTPIPSDWPVPRWSEPKVKTAAGYAPTDNLLDVFVGQEGTLGVITEATVRLTKQPSGVLGILAWFRSREDAVAFAVGARSAARGDRVGALSPRCIEYLDHHCVDLARSRVGDVPEGARAALFCEQEIETTQGEDAHIEAWFEALEQGDALIDDTLIATDRRTQEQLHALRHAIPAGINEQIIKNGLPKVGTDLAVPDQALDVMMDAYEASPMDHVLFGHLGDNHLHLNLLPTSEAELKTARAYYDQLARLAIDNGGTVSAEHGIGKLKRKHLSWMIGDETLASFRDLKRRLDPSWILGRGNLLDSPTPSTDKNSEAWV